MSVTPLQHRQIGGRRRIAAPPSPAASRSSARALAFTPTPAVTPATRRGAMPPPSPQPSLSDTADHIDADFRQFVAARSASLLRTAYLLVGDWSHAEDMLQASLTKTYLAWRRLGQIEAVDAYARRVLVNTATSWWRRRWHGEKPTAVLPERSQPDQAEER